MQAYERWLLGIVAAIDNILYWGAMLEEARLMTDQDDTYFQLGDRIWLHNVAGTKSWDYAPD